MSRRPERGKPGGRGVMCSQAIGRAKAAAGSSCRAACEWWTGAGKRLRRGGQRRQGRWVGLRRDWVSQRGCTESGGPEIRQRERGGRDPGPHAGCAQPAEAPVAIDVPPSDLAARDGGEVGGSYRSGQSTDQDQWSNLGGNQSGLSGVGFGLWGGEVMLLVAAGGREMARRIAARIG
jgi:hypothetical protein